MSVKCKTIPITLYAPSLDKTIENHIINPAQSYSTILQSIRKSLNTRAPVFAYNLKRLPITDFTSLNPPQTLLITTCYFERPLAVSPQTILLPQLGAAEDAWMDLSPLARRAYIKSLRASSPDNGITYLALPFSIAKAHLDSPAAPCIESCLETMQQNWALPIEAILGFQGLVMPYGPMETWEEMLVPMLAVLSEVLAGQGDVVSGLLVEKVKGRGGGCVSMQDVVEIGKELYKRGLE